MRYQTTIIAAAGLASSMVSAMSAPNYDGFNKDWESIFIGDSATLPSEEKWNILDNAYLGINNERQTYMKSTNNVQLSGGETLQIVPRRDSSGAWTSGRLESKFNIVPEDGRITKVESKIRFQGTFGKAQGIWPAVWMMGANVGQVGWPACGELDMFEMRNADMVGHGVVHCDVPSGGICNEGYGIVNEIAIPGSDWHIWSVEWDQTRDNWMDDTITWYMDGQQYHQISGGRIGNEGVWGSLARNPMYFIVNLAVGGIFPGDPNDQTADGFDSMLEVAYVAAYKSI